MIIQKTATFAKKELKTLMIKVVIELEISAVMQVNIKVLHIA